MTSSGKSKKIGYSSSSSCIDGKKKDRGSRLKVWQPMQEIFANAVNYRKACLKNKFHRFDSSIALKVTKLVKELRYRLKETDFDDIDTISIPAFLEEACDACGSIDIHKEVATFLIFYFVKKPTSSFLKVHLLLKKFRATGTRDEKLLS